MSINDRFSGRVAVVTGGSSGIGEAVTERLVAEGARVAIWDTNLAKASPGGSQFSAQTIALPTDVTDEESIARALAETLNVFGRIDILVASAGITGPNATVANYPVNAWKQVLDVNLTGVFLSNRAVVPTMLAQDYGRIVNIASVAGKEGNPNASAYSASKAGVIALTKSLAKELATSKVVANCVTPAAVRTAIFDQMQPDFIDYMLTKIPMGRFGTVQEIASLVAWIASDECSFSTGAVFDATGGRSTY
jgi:3-oxoacyl-[acyl-carrier protein] reductase